MAATYDLMVIGDDAPSLCAAAAAAQSGAATALAATGAVTFGGPSVCDIPNAVWRRLDLQSFGLDTDPVSARITLFANGESTATFQKTDDTANALRETDSEAAALWPDLVDDFRVLGDASANSGASGATTMLAQLDSRRAFVDLGRLTGSGSELIDDYINGSPLKAHVKAHALAPFGLGGEEAGSAEALPDFFDEYAWRVRAKSGARSVIGALRKACEVYGVDAASASVERANADGAKHNSILFGNGEKIRTRYIFFASPDAAEAAGYDAAGATASANGGRAVMRLKLRDTVEPPAGDARALFQVIDDGSAMKNAREDALTGRISDALPVEFEFTDKGDIVARTSYIPAQLQEEGEWRDWTGQDRQMLSSTIVNRLASRIDGLHGKIKKTDLKIISQAGAEKNKFSDAQNIIVQPRRHNATAAAIALIDKVLADD